jgi:type VI secretion system secreted protein Hcp
MFLKVAGVTGESGDADHKGEIEVLSWSWGMQASVDVATGHAAGRASISDLQIVKRVDLSTPTLMSALRNNKPFSQVTLTVRKAGEQPLTYFKIVLENARVTSLRTESEAAELSERLSLGFSKIRVTYTPQSSTGAKGGGDNVFETDAHAGK